MSDRWLILADDLSGAADAGVAFARRGRVTEVRWNAARAPAADAEVIAFDTDSRRLDAAAAAARQREALQALPARDATLYKKIDSTLRGQPAAEIAAIRAAMGEACRRVVFAPANPAMGRRTRDGRVFVRDLPLEQTETWRREHTYANADLEDVLGSAGLRAIKLPLDVVRSPPRLARALDGIAGPTATWICDAETDADLAAIARAGLVHAGTLFAGTAGLAQALAAQLAPRRFSPLDLRPVRTGTLIVVGSLSSISRAAAAELARQPNVSPQRVPSQMLRDPRRAGELATLGASVAATLAAGADVLVEIATEAQPDLAAGPALVRALAAGLGPARHAAGGLIVTGGETAAALLDGWYFHGVRLIDEVAPGISLGVALGERQLPMVTKPGGFGDARSLVLSLEALRRLRARD
ncbi:MAG TPA: four-carbon acid sugar kinase family protein [Steroidobacteraceae bacterium]|nr:four-carbon acid sugar kinase family protein [Steroidobacteraceae bacterium]